MQLPDDITTHWCTIVDSKQVCKITIPSDTDLRILNACAVPDEGCPEKGRAILYAKVNDIPENAIVPFRIGAFESTSIDLHLVDGDVCEFRISGAPVSVHLTGYLSGSFEVETEGNKPTALDADVQEGESKEEEAEKPAEEEKEK